ncbi:AAA family ATPase [Agathobaculum sp.]|uniref:AAA family ATPase n=1 Tax=Agathobaculum sp. TaxID=2048138 RepID=UPI0039A282BD
MKVITGIRRCGKSCLLKLMMQHLKAQGVAENQIVAMNFLLRLCQTASGARETDVFLL